MKNFYEAPVLEITELEVEENITYLSAITTDDGSKDNEINDKWN